MSANKENHILLGDLIEECRNFNYDNLYDVNALQGVTSEGTFAASRANTSGIDFSKYKIVEATEFAYNPARINLGSIALRRGKPCIISPMYIVFKIKEDKKEKILVDYLDLILSRKEFHRSTLFYAMGSVRDTFDFNRMKEVVIPLPPIAVQQELVDTYNGLKALAEQNETLIPRLAEACQAYIVDCKAKYPAVALGDYIDEYNELNSDNKIKIVKSVSVFKEFRDTNAKVNKDELSRYKIVPDGYMSYVQTTKNEKCFACCVNHFGKPIVVTSVNRVLYVTDFEKLNIDFLFLFLNRKEFDRYAIFNSWGSAREVFQWEDLKAVQIPLPPYEVQQSVVDLYNCMERAKEIAKQARERLKTLCPALVQRAANA